MGRSSKKENTTNDTTEFQEQSETTTFPYPTETQPASTRAITESESMARDIKEGRLSGFVGAGTVLTGETNFNSILRIDGHLTGRVTSENGTLVVGSTGQVDANIEVSSAMVNGIVNGDIIASEKLELGRTARVVGNIKSPRLIISDGAILEGSCSMIKSKETFDQKAIEEEQKFTTNELPIDPIMETSSEEMFENDEEDIFVEKTEAEVEDDEETADAATS
jgi:cytoskeletal protein CcmA (bactofilin family)